MHGPDSGLALDLALVSQASLKLPAHQQRGKEGSMCWGAQMGSTAGEQQLGTHLQQGYVALGLGWNQKVLEPKQGDHKWPSSESSGQSDVSKLLAS